MAILGVLIMLMIRPNGHTPANSVFISLKQAIYSRFVQLRGFDELDMKQLYDQTSQRNRGI